MKKKSCLITRFFNLVGQPSESVTMSQPGVGIGCSSACVKLPQSDVEAFAQSVRQVSLCVLLVIGFAGRVLFSQELVGFSRSRMSESACEAESWRQSLITLGCVVTGAVYLLPQTRNRLVIFSPQFFALVTALLPLTALCAVNLSPELPKQATLSFPQDLLLFRAFVHGAGNAALCGPLRLQIASCAVLDVVVMAIGFYRRCMMSSTGSWDSTRLWVGSAGPPGDDSTCLWDVGWFCVKFFAVHWLALLSMNVLILKGLKPCSTRLQLT